MEMLGKVFGRWTVLSEGKTVRWTKYWICQCQCGRVKEVNGGNLRSGLSSSCGCLPREKRAENFHGMSDTKVWRAWKAMRQRVKGFREKDYNTYTMHGITVCDRWQVFENFLADMGEPPSELHTLDRYPNPNGNYEPGNCRWATYSDQNLNLRTSSGFGKRKVDMAKELGVSLKTFNVRLRNGKIEE